MPSWLRMSWWVQRGAAFGSSCAYAHPAAAVWFVYALCGGVVGLTTAQAVSHWHGAHSAAAFAAGVVPAVVVLRRQLRGAATMGLQNSTWLIGAVAGVVVVCSARVSHPGAALATTQSFADGYAAGLFAGLLPFIRRPG